MAISLKDLVGERKQNTSQYTRGRNVHVKVVDYEQTPNGVKVHGTDLVTGNDVKIALADQNKFVQFYTSKNKDMSVRLDHARKMIENRPTLTEFSASRGNKSVPVGGVISFSDVREDIDTHELYARWPQGMVHIPEAETALTGMLEVRSHLSKNAQGQEVKTSYINYMDVKNSFDPTTIEGGDKKQLTEDFDKLFSGKLAGTDSPARTGALISLKMADGVGAFVLNSPLATREKNGEKVYFADPGVDKALSQKLKSFNAVAAVTVAALIGKDIKSLNLSEIDDANKPGLEQLYTAVQEGKIKVVVTPSMQLSPTRFQNNDFWGLRQQQDGSVQATRTATANLLDRGYFAGAVGVRTIAQKTNERIQPIVKAIQSDTRLPAQSSDAFVRLNLQAVGEMAFQRVELQSKQPEVGLKNDHENDHGNHNVQDEDMGIDDASFDVPSAEF